jgi:hypothetical protein
MRLSRFYSCRSVAGLLLFVAGFATSAFAGPPLICHRFEIGDAKSLPWSAAGWDLSGNENYDTHNLAHDTMALLDDNTPVIVRMETLRRATLYARKDQYAAKELLTKLYQRGQASEASGHQSALAWFDVGYLAEAYAQMFYKGPNPAAGIEGYNLVSKAIALRGKTDPQMELAAALITLRGPQKEHEIHTQRALAGAKADPLLARNLANSFRGDGKITIAALISQSTQEGAKK